MASTAYAARLVTSGFETGSATAGVENQLETVTGTAFTVVASPVRTGAYAAKFLPSSSNGYVTYNFTALTSGQTLYERFYIYISTLPAANTYIMKSKIAAGNVYYGIVLTTEGKLQLFNDFPTQQGSDSSVLSTGTWYRVEVSYAYATGAIEAKIDGATAFASGTATSSKAINQMDIGSIDSPASGEWEMDDIAVNDSAGTYQTGYPGDGKIVHLLPNGVGTAQNWIVYAGSGINGCGLNVNLWNCIKEVPPDDTTTMAAARTNTYSHDITLSDASFSGTINVVHVAWRFRRSASSPPPAAISISDGTNSTGSAGVTPGSSFTTNATAAPRLFPLTLYQTPSSTTWTTTILNGSYISLYCAGTATPYFQVTAAWVAVDYTPDTTPPTLTSATVATSGTSVDLLFDEAVTIGAGGNSGWTISMSLGAGTTMAYASGSGTTTLTYNITGRTILSGETGTVSYTQPGNGIEDIAGNDLATISSASVTNNSTQTDSTAPTLTSATIPAVGTNIELLFGEMVKIGSGGNGGWTLSMSGGAATMTYVSGSGAADKKLIYSLSRTVGSIETGTISYTQPTNGIEDLSGNDLANISSTSVTNNSTGTFITGDALLLGGD